jgi:hypothetical protein
MSVIQIFHDRVKYNGIKKLFEVSGARVPFATSHQLVNEKTKEIRLFEFFQSTGSEWDAGTKWIYTNTKEGLILSVGNEDVTQEHRDNYIKAKS